MIKSSYIILILLVVIVLGSTFYISQTTSANAHHRTQIYNALSNLKNSYYYLKLHLHADDKKTDIEKYTYDLEIAKDDFLKINSNIVDSKIIEDEIAHIIKAAKNNQTFDSSLLEILDTIAFNYDLEQNINREHVFSFQKVLVSLFILMISVLLYLIYSNNKEKIKLFRMQRQLEQSLVTDALTGLQNRVAITKMFDKDLYFSVVVFNIAKFKHINDFYGVGTGDYVLKEFAKELKNLTAACNNANVYRVGGDDFVVVVQTSDLESVTMMANRTIKHFQNNGIAFGDDVIDIHLVGGITQTRPYLETVDLALKEAKKDKNISIAVYNENLNESNIIKKNINAVKMLKEGIAYNRFFPEFQPIVDLKTGQITKYEALIRLKDENGTIIYPLSFIEEAKDSKLLNKLTKIMLIKSFETFKHLDCSFSVNLSFSELVDEKNQDAIIEILDQYGRHSKKLTFEILEDEAIDDYNLLDRFLSKVQKFGVDIAIDDFGSGYSNFGHIISMNTHFLKIDASLIKIIDYDVQARVLVKSIVDFAKSMHIKTVAEFVHSKDVLDTVKRLGVDYAQGFYLGKPSSDVSKLNCGIKL